MFGWHLCSDIKKILVLDMRRRDVERGGEGLMSYIREFYVTYIQQNTCIPGNMVWMMVC
jgi:hypothetical protein